MKVSLKSIAIILITMMLIAVLPTTVKATYSATVSIQPDKKEVKPGDTVTLVIVLKDIEDVGTGILDMLGKIEYDSNFFEDDIQVDSGATWMMGKDNLFMIGAAAPVTQSGKRFAGITMKVKENATGTSAIKFTELITSSGDGEAVSPNVTLTFTVDKNNQDKPVNPDDDEDPTTPNDKEDPATPSDKNDPTTPDNKEEEKPTISDEEQKPGIQNNTVNTNKSEIQNNTKVNNTIISTNITNSSSQTLPKAGIETKIFAMITIAAIIGTGSYILYRRYRKI